MINTIKISCQGAVNLPIDEFVHFQGNLKDLSEENYLKLRKEIMELGYSEPVSVWKHDGKTFLLNGHQRIRTLRKMKEEGFEIPNIPANLIDAFDLKEAKKKVLALTSQYGEMTREGLYEFMSEADLSMDDIESSFRFPEIRMDDFKTEYFDEPVKLGLCDEDELPEKVEPRACAGDVYRLGSHRLMCGDATKIDHVKTLMGTDLADMVWTDPPYNVAYEGKTKEALTIQNDEMSAENFYQFLYDAYSGMLMYTKPGGAIYVAHADSEGMNFRRAMTESGWLIKQCLIWVKQSLVMGRQDYHWKHEPILYGWAPGASHNWYSDRKQTTVLEFDRPHRNAEHPTMKPIELIEYCIGNSCVSKGMVLDLFGGSGSTMIACEKTHRSARLMELDPKYCDVIIARWEKFTGDKAELIYSGSDTAAKVQNG